MRFTEVDSETVTFIDNVKQQFPEIASATIKSLFSNKKKKSQGRYVLAWIQRTNDLTKLLSADNIITEGYDYILFIDELLWDNMDEKDRERLIRHELCHIEVDLEANNPYKIKDHEITDFYSEVEYNKDDPRWAERLATMADSLYDNNDE